MKLFASVRQLALTATLASGIVVGAIAPSEACLFSKGKGTAFNTNSPLKTQLANLDPKQLGLMGAGVMFLGGVAVAGMLSRQSDAPAASDEWEVEEFPIVVPPEALEASVEAETTEELTTIR
ncbi:MAG: hypothetical protein AB4041_04905 [Microcystaceae cyanobacterium]